MPLKIIGKIDLPKTYYWIGQIEGLVFASKQECPILKPFGKMKYMGWSTDTRWPKTMNTGRVLCLAKDKKKRRRKRKNLENDKGYFKKIV